MSEVLGATLLTNALELRPGSRVLILGGYGVRNVGDEAILAGMLRELPSRVRPTVISRNPNETSVMHSVRAVGVTMAPAELARADMLIVGGGGLFSSDTGPFGRQIPAFARIALWMRKQVAFHGIGVYPSASEGLLRQLASLSGRLALLTVRDRISQETLARQGVASTLIPDLSESMTEVLEGEQPSLGELLALDPSKPTVCLCLTAINQELASFLLNGVPQVMDSTPEAQFCFIPMSLHPTKERHNDLAFARQLKALRHDLHVLEGWRGPSEYLALIGQADAVVCSRFHSFLFAQRADRPIIPLPYSAKCDGWLEDHGIESMPWSVEALRDRMLWSLSKSARGTVAV